MHIPKYALVDAFDALSACPDPNARWACATDVTRALGVDSINAGAIDIASSQLLWARSSMKPSWLETYVAQDFEKIDPLIALFGSKDSRRTVYCDESSIEQGRDGGHPTLSAALNEAGYVLLHGTKFLDAMESFGSMVTLCFEDMAREKFDQSISSWTTIAALLSGFSMAPDGTADHGVFAFSKPQLSKREVEVYSLLATGLQTGRIAERLGIAEITVAKHFRTGRQKLRSATRAQALIKAMRLDLLSF